MSAEGTGIKELIPVEDQSKWIAPKSDPEKLALMIKDYIENRPVQKLNTPIDITELISDFLNVVDQKRIAINQ